MIEHISERCPLWKLCCALLKDSRCVPLTFFDGFLPRSEGCQGTGRLELWLHPVLGVSVVAGQVDPQTTILRQQNKCSLLLQEKWKV